MVPSISGTIHTDSGLTNYFNLFIPHIKLPFSNCRYANQPKLKLTYSIAAYISDSAQFPFSNSSYIKFEIIALNNTKVIDTIDIDQDLISHY